MHGEDEHILRVVRELIDISRKANAVLNDVVAKLEERFDDDGEEEPKDLVWQSFLEGHPELARSGDRASLTFSDEELVAALEEAFAGTRRSKWYPGVLTSSVAAVLAGGSGRASHGDLCRIGQRLGALSRAGRVDRIAKHGHALQWIPRSGKS